MSTIDSRKAKRIQRIQEEILEAAATVISQKGFKSATTKEIAKEADMAEGTLYNYFKNKNEILMTIVERYVNNKRDFNVSTEVESVQEFILNMYKQNADIDQEAKARDRKIIKALIPELLTDKTLGPMYYERIVKPYLETLEEKLTILKSKGIVEDFDVKILSRLLYTSLIGYAILEINGDPEVAEATNEFKSAFAHTYVDVFGRGMGK
ncbi:TetR/AcrR family transcriptional regulator [Vallitalea okinawensis]|uniref:TetR/AcrR family transcriptional regulator n=1 Tax=Vallitalea okinawensis TaxID=2078660 RepID=UPI001300BAC6|nr:TetR/AcrR family transcriptional regulator [Vallitalea okinawensis]